MNMFQNFYRLCDSRNSNNSRNHPLHRQTMYITQFRSITRIWNSDNNNNGNNYL